MTPDPSIPRHLAPGHGPVYWMFGDLVTVKAAAADTGGAYALFEARTAPGQGPPLHRQWYDDEAFFILEGTYAVRIGEQAATLGPGGYAFAPRGLIHGYTNVGTGPGRLLILVSPGGIHEQLVAEIGTPIDQLPALRTPDGVPDITRLALAAEKYGLEFHPQPGRVAPPERQECGTARRSGRGGGVGP